MCVAKNWYLSNNIIFVYNVICDVSVCWLNLKYTYISTAGPQCYIF